MPWTGRETADITYHDSDGILTKLLVDKGYLDTSPWLGRPPRYYLEVKSTTGDCDNAFYMSKYQYERVTCNNSSFSSFFVCLVADYAARCKDTPTAIPDANN
jgi:hypothetical protein